jgi:hypothetical protein
MAPNRALGLLLIAIGSIMLLVLTTGLGGEVVVALVGVGFLTAYARTESYGFLIPGAILTGLGAGILVESWGGPTEAVPLGLGTGFLAIAVVDRLRGSAGPGWWWPPIPGGVLTVTAASTMSGLDRFEPYLLPVALIVIGATLVIRRGRAPSEPPGVAPQDRVTPQDDRGRPSQDRSPGDRSGLAPSP